MNKTGNYTLTIIVPVYNEEDNMPRLEEKLGLCESSPGTYLYFVCE